MVPSGGGNAKPWELLNGSPEGAKNLPFHSWIAAFVPKGAEVLRPEEIESVPGPGSRSS